MKSSAVSRNHLPWRGGGAGRSGAGRRSGGGRSSSRQQDALLRPFLDQQGVGSRSMATVRRDKASIEVTRALHSDLGNSRRCEFVRRLQVISAIAQTAHRADKPNDRDCGEPT
jgi:hypothetical protein